MKKNIISIANLIDRKSSYRTWYTRQARIKKEGSPYYTYEMGAIAATASLSIELDAQFPASKKYSPLDYCEIANNDVVDIYVYFNNEDRLPVYAGTIREVSNKPIRTVRVDNRDAAVTSTSTAIVLTFRRDPVTIDDWARKQ